jgi:DNA-binding transcriptional LysR family regulator
LRVGHTVSGRTYLERLRELDPQRRWNLNCLSAVEASSESLARDLLTGELDLAFLHPPLRHPAIRYEALGEERLVVVCSPTHQIA